MQSGPQIPLVVNKIYETFETIGFFFRVMDSVQVLNFLLFQIGEFCPNL